MLSTGGEHDRSSHVIDGEVGEVHDDLRCVIPAARCSRTSTTSTRVPTKRGLSRPRPPADRSGVRGPRTHRRPRDDRQDVYVAGWWSTDLYAEVMEFVRITTSPDKMGGVPCIRDLRFPVATVVAMVADGMTNDEILREHPDLELGDISEALHYAALAVQERELPLRLPA